MTISVSDPFPIEVAASAGSVASSVNIQASTIGPQGPGNATDPDVSALVTSGAQTGPAVDTRIDNRIPNYSGASGAVVLTTKTQTLTNKDLTGSSNKFPALGIIAYGSYNPGTLSTYSIAATATADVDATNLVVTFTAPASGKVRVRLEAVSGCTGVAADNVTWTLRSGTTDVASGMAFSGGTGGGNNSVVRTFIITGLTAGNSYTYKWGWKSNSTGNTGHLYVGGNVGAAIMEVFRLV